jgi:hypothetical protein
MASRTAPTRQLENCLGLLLFAALDAQQRARALPREPLQLRARRGDGQRYFCAINFVPVGPMPVI